jgi:hypothetical protein
MSFYQSLTYPTDANERRHDRQQVSLAARVRELGRPGAAGQLQDISVGGCRLIGVDLPKSAEIWVAIGTAPPRRASVVWTSAGETGCVFYAPMTRAELRNVILQRG